MVEPIGRTVQVSIYLSARDQRILARYVAEINALIEAAPAASKKVHLANLSEEEAIAVLFGLALDREREMQRINDGNDLMEAAPDWLKQAVEEAIKEMK